MGSQTHNQPGFALQVGNPERLIGGFAGDQRPPQTRPLFSAFGTTFSFFLKARNAPLEDAQHLLHDIVLALVFRLHGVMLASVFRLHDVEAPIQSACKVSIRPFMASCWR